MTAAARLAQHLEPGALVAIGDGAGAPVGLGAAIAEAAGAVGDISLLLGWSLCRPVATFAPFRSVRALMGGYALRAGLNSGEVEYLPVRLSSMPALLHGPLRPSVLLAGLVPGPRGLTFGTEIGWMQAAVDAGALVLAEVNHGLPHATAGEPLSAERVIVVSEVDRPPIAQQAPEVRGRTAEIGRLVAELVPEGASVQYPPGAVGQAVLDALEVPVAIDSGVVTDAVMHLEGRRLLVGEPRCTYLVGSSELYAWADGRPLADRVELTHDPSRLSRLERFVAVNTALEIDETGQVNVESVAGDAIGGIGGQPDFAFAASHSAGGLSVIALPTAAQGRSTLVERLSAPTSTLRSDVDVVVTERGMLDLRGLGDVARRRGLRALWGE